MGAMLRMWCLLLLLHGAGMMTTTWPAGPELGSAAPEHERLAMVRQVEQMYSHAFESYMAHAFPADELRPLSCDGRRVRERGDLDMVLGNYSMTLVDALDSLVAFRRHEDFERAVAHIVERVDFDLDIEVSTFELNIRMLGGLLSGHLHATRLLGGYGGGLLAKALDLAHRLLPAFDTPTRMPVSRINLRRGKPEKVSNTVTIAEAGSFLLEFGVLTLLTGDASYYDTAKGALLAFWRRRSSLGLVGTTIDVRTGAYQDAQSTTGPGQDSFYEYLLKGYILFDDMELLDMFMGLYEAVERHHTFEGFTYNVDMWSGQMSNPHLSPLSCIWGSLQVLAGDVPGGLQTVLYWYGLWSKHGALPEVFDTKTEAPTAARDSPLRPELTEAIFYLSLALPDDPQIFRILQSMVSALDSQSRVPCGFASVADVTTKRLDDRMDSYFLSETLVYLYFSLMPPAQLKSDFPWPIGSTVFSTEGHMFPLPHAFPYKISRIPSVADRVSALYPAASRRPLLTCDAMSPFERVAVQQRCRTKYILTPSHKLQTMGHSSMQCRAQEVTVLVHGMDQSAPPLLVMQGIISSFGPSVPTLPSPFRPRGSGSATNSSDSGGQRCRPAYGPDGSATLAAGCGDGDAGVEPFLQDELGLARLDLDRSPGRKPAFTRATARQAPIREFFAMRHVVRAEPFHACGKLEEVHGRPASEYYDGKLVLVSRGRCLFLEKLQHLQEANAAGAIVVNLEGSNPELQVMTCPLQEQGASRDVHTPSVMVSSDDGAALQALISAYSDREVTASMFSAH